MTTQTRSSNAGTARGSTRLIVLGVVVLVVLLIAAIALWLAGEQRRADNVANFARAPVGCDTTLDFDRMGSFVVFVETSGRVEQLAGACDADLEYDREVDDDLPTELAPGLLLLDPDGNPVDILVTPGSGYDVDGFVGTAEWTIEIDEPGDHVLTVLSIGGDPFAIAVGRSADDGVALLRWSAVAVAIVALVVGGALLVAGSRRSAEPEEPAVAWTPGAPAWPSSPPGFPVPPPTTGAVGPPSTPPSPAGADDAPAPPPASPTRPPAPWGPPTPPSN